MSTILIFKYYLNLNCSSFLASSSPSLLLDPFRRTETNIRPSSANQTSVTSTAAASGGNNKQFLILCSHEINLKTIPVSLDLTSGTTREESQIQKQLSSGYDKETASGNTNKGSTCYTFRRNRKARKSR